MGSFIQFLIQYNAKIIYSSVAVICLLSAVVVWWQVFGKKGLQTGASSELDLEQIEETLKKILNQTNVAMNNIPSSSGSAEPNIEGVVDSAGNPIQDITGVKTELAERAMLIEELKNQVAAASNDTSSVELLAKIRDLEGKLAEYEIIEDDIADLSFFKEENAKLKRELDGIKRAGPAMVDQFAAAVAEAEAAQPKPEVKPEVKLEVKPEVKSEEEAKSLEAAVAVAQAQKPEAPPAESDVAGDIFSEFAGEGSGDDPLSALGDLDADRMLDELKDLNADFEIGAESLDEAPDIDKMASEAVDLPKKG